MAASPSKSLPVPNLGRKTCKEQNHTARRQLPLGREKWAQCVSVGEPRTQEPSCSSAFWASKEADSALCTISASAWIKILHLCLHPRNPASSFTGSFGSGHISSWSPSLAVFCLPPSGLTHSKWLLRAHFSVCPIRCPPSCPRPLSLKLLRGSLEPLVFPPYVLSGWPLQVITTSFMSKERDTQNRKLIFSRSRETQNGKITSP